MLSVLIQSHFISIQPPCKVESLRVNILLFANKSVDVHSLNIRVNELRVILWLVLKLLH